jgi:PLP dependent protein
MSGVDDLLPSAEEIRGRHDALAARLRAAAERAGRDPDAFRVVAITKGWPLAVCRAALEAGLRALGENRVQEALPKIEALPEAEWHLVGHLQTNKARRAAETFAWIHAVDSLPLLSRLDEAGAGRVLLQVNVTGEARKAGFDAGWFAAESSREGELVGALRGLGTARVVGLMTMARYGADETEARATFRRLRELRDQLEQTSRIGLHELSMGMTDDAAAAVAEGATLVRIGTALFGTRPGTRPG